MVDNYYDSKHYDTRKSFGYLIRRGSSLITNAVEALFAEKDLTFIQYVILMHLRDNLAGNCGELSEAVRYDSGALTRVIDQMESRGFLARERCTDDRRVVKLHITEAGRAVTEALIPIVAGQYNQWLADFTQEEADTLVRLMTKLNSAIISGKAGE